MARRRRSVGRTLALAAGLPLVALALPGCAKSTPQVVVARPLGFNQVTARDANGPYPKAQPSLSCGSDTEAFGTELLTTSPANAKVTREWGEVVPGRGPLWYAAGEVSAFTFSQGDLNFTHPFDKDITFDIKLDPVFAPMSQRVGPGADDPDGPAPGSLHWEISRGLFPHQDASSYLPGWIPANGDRVISTGRWIVDCGHDDFHTEMHPPVFVAFTHASGTTSVTHTFYNPYYETQLYTPDATLAADFANDARFTDPNTRTFPTYLVHQIYSLIHVGAAPPGGYIDHLEAHMLLAANTQAVAPWYACAPGSRPNGAKLSVKSSFTVRPGVTIEVEPDDSLGCAKVTALMGAGYTPYELTQKDCVEKWSDLNQQAQAALANPDVDILKAVQAQVPPEFRAAIARDPSVDCFDPLVVTEPGGPGGTAVFEDANQPYPFYGTVVASWT